MKQDIQVFYQATPNPQAMKFVISCQIAEESLNIPDAASARCSPLAEKIFGFPWASGVFIAPDAVTITKQDWVGWEILADPLSNLIKEHLEAGEAVLVKNEAADEGENDSETVKQIKQILNDEIRPAVAMDGGDIVFHKYEDRKLYVHMHGACSGCPSSAMTLKQGVETRLRQSIPELEEVVPL